MRSNPNGGNNDETNLVALCRNCHGEKTFQERVKNHNLIASLEPDKI